MKLCLSFVILFVFIFVFFEVLFLVLPLGFPSLDKQSTFHVCHERLPFQQHQSRLHKEALIGFINICRFVPCQEILMTQNWMTTHSHATVSWKWMDSSTCWPARLMTRTSTAPIWNLKYVGRFWMYIAWILINCKRGISSRQRNSYWLETVKYVWSLKKRTWLAEKWT